jgi:hypothetical protein
VVTIQEVLATGVIMPPFPVGPEAARERFFHHLEWCPGWEYKTTSIREADVPPRASTESYPGGWDYKATRPDGFHLNSDKGVGYDKALAGWMRLTPGVLRNPGAGGGPVLVAYWRRKL